MKVSDRITASEIAVFRRSYPVGTDTTDWLLKVVPSPEDQSDFHLKFKCTPYVKTDGSVEEALTTLFLLPTKMAPRFHFTLPMMRTAFYNIRHGSQRSISPHKGGTYQDLSPYDAHNEVELARWILAACVGYNQEQKEAILGFAAQFWNAKGSQPMKQMLGKDVEDCSPAQSELMGMMIMGMMLATEVLGIGCDESASADTGRPSCLPSLADMMLTLGLYDK